MTSYPWRNGNSSEENTNNNNNNRPRPLGRKVIQAVQENLVAQSFWEVFRVFCRETNLHGMKHIFGTNSDYNLWHKRMAVRISRVLWFLSCIAGIMCAVIMGSLVWRRFKINPTITTIATTNHPIWEVPFPSVTICNINKVYAPNAVNITRLLMEKGVSLERIYKFFELIPNLINPEYVDSEFLSISAILQGMNYTTETLMSEIAQPCDKLLRKCFWKGKETECHELFKLSRSTEGICCSFNYKALRRSLEIDTEFQYSTQTIQYVSGTGKTMGLNVLLDIETKHSLGMAKPIYGAEVLIHDAEDFPQASLTSGIAQPGHDMDMAIVPSVIISKPAIRGVPVDVRQCYFADEEKLRATQKYSQNSCMAECQVNYIISKCSCIPFFFPEPPSIGNKYRQCVLNDVDCLRRNQATLASVQPPDGSKGFNTTEQIGMNCTCFSACSETTYGLHTIDVIRQPNLRSWLYTDMDLTNLTTMAVHFRDLTCILYRRDVYQTWDGLFASFGGIFGLCLGGSILSLVEMSYFFTIRLTLIIYRRIVNMNKDKADGQQKSQVERQRESFQRAVAESRPIYSLTPVLNKHYKRLQEEREAEQKQAMVNNNKKSKVAW